MALIVEEGTGLSTADSFISVADSDSYHAKFGNADWMNADAIEKEVHLRRGMRWLVTRFDGRWRGTKVKESQALPFPRYGVYDADGNWISSSTVPTALPEAQAEMALRSLLGEDLNPDLDGGAIKREKVETGPVVEEIEYLGAKRELKSFTLVEAMLRQFLKPVGRLSRS